MRASRRPRALSLSRRRVEDARVVAGFSSRVPNEATTMREEEVVERRVVFCAQNLERALSERSTVRGVNQWSEKEDKKRTIYKIRKKRTHFFTRSKIHGI